MNGDRREVSGIGWTPEDPNSVCMSCGAGNPDSHDVCGSCGENPSNLPELPRLSTWEQLMVYLAFLQMREPGRAKKIYKRLRV